MFCSNCGKEMQDGSNICKNCGCQLNPQKKPNGCLTGIAIVILIFIVFPLFIEIISSSSSETASDSSTKTTSSHSNPFTIIENKVADDAVEQYNIAKRQGDKMQICVQAGFVSAAYLQAKDENNYRKWKSIQKTDCRAAGLPEF